jgi:hypothetical protein
MERPEWKWFGLIQGTLYANDATKESPKLELPWFLVFSMPVLSSSYWFCSNSISSKQIPASLSYPKPILVSCNEKNLIWNPIKSTFLHVYWNPKNKRNEECQCVYACIYTSTCSFSQKDWAYNQEKMSCNFYF